MRRRPRRTALRAKAAGVVQARAENSEEAQPGILDEIRRLQKTYALLIAVQFAADHDAEFDTSDAVAAIIILVEQTLDGLDRLEAVP